jgi:Tol biopolymer transport system component/DNA-binding winged helix-turn-helix (wHTH) protein
MDCFSFGPFLLDRTARVLLRDDRPVVITAKIFESLVMLVENRGRVVAKTEFLATLWPDTMVEEANLAQTISTLRKVLDDTPKQHRYIATIPGRGYSFVASVFESSSVWKPASHSLFSKRARALYYLISSISVLVLLGIAEYFLARRLPQAPTFYSSVPLTSYIGSEICPSFAPDGERVVFAWDGETQDNFDIYIKQIGGGPPLRLTSDPAPDISPAWSPDGRTIAFLRVIGDGKARVLLISAVAPGPARQLATVTALPESYFHLRFISWSPDGKWLALSDGPSSRGVMSLFLLSIETGEKRRLTFPSVDYDDLNPAFSPDKSHLAFVRYSSWGANASDLYLLELSSDLKPKGQPQRLTALNRQAASPIWTSDGRAILFTRHETAGSHSFWRINIANDRNIVPIPIPTDNSVALTLSSQGKRLVYSRDASVANVWGINLTALQNHRVSSTRSWITSTWTEDNPQFSPDGQQIAYESVRSGRSEIWICDRDGLHSRQLTSLESITSSFARWSPDGKSIVFQSRPQSSAHLYIVDASGGKPRQLTSGPGNEISPSWSHDGKWIYFASRRTGENQIWRMPANGGPATQMTKRSAWCPLESADGQYLYYVTIPMLELWRLPLPGGPEEKIISGLAVTGSAYAPAKRSIYFIRPTKDHNKQELACFRLATGKITALTPIPGHASLGLTLSRDERLILYGQTDHLGSDLMLVDNFH